jgi:hypothetical protein
MQVRIALKERIGHLIDIYSMYTYRICVADRKRYTLMNWQLAFHSQVSSLHSHQFEQSQMELTVYPSKKVTKVSPTV